ncbi:cholinesterase-like [Amblyomma americanum]
MGITAIAGAILLVSVAHASTAPVVRTQSGDVEGIQLNVYGEKVNAFLGIPYAAPPTGELRFRKPLPKAPWSRVRLAKTFGNRCIQELALETTPDLYVGRPGASEDCLRINVWSPVSDNSTKPVLVWIHGGNFKTGSSDNPAFDGSVLAATQNVVVVSFNYRLGFLGFLNAVHNNASGNAGLFDQVLALSWVQSNIAPFNGNASLVTLFGEGAGAVAIRLHMISPLTRGLFRRVIMQGGAAHKAKAVESTGRSLLKADALAVEVGCSKGSHSIVSHPNDVVDCLKSRSTLEILLAQVELRHHGIEPALPTHGTEFLPHSPDLIHDLRGFTNAEVLMGHNREEGRKLVSSVFEGRFEELKQANNMTREDAEVALHILLSAKGYRRPVASEVVQHCLKHAVAFDPRTLAELVENCAADVATGCTTLAFARKLANAGLSVHYYVIDYAADEAEGYFHTSVDHAAETALAFGLPMRYPGKFEESDRSFSKTIMNAWATFAKRGTPLAFEGTLWPRFTEARPMYLDINEASAHLREADNSLCSLLKK